MNTTMIMEAGRRLAIRTNVRDKAIVAGLMTAVLIFYGIRIHETIAAGVVDNVVFGADPATRLQAFVGARYWRMGYELHPLACLWALLTGGPLQLVGATPQNAAAFSLALAAAVGTGALFGALRLTGVSRIGAAAVTMLAMSSFSTLTGFSVVDTYAVSFTAINGALFAVLAIARRWPSNPRLAAVSAGIALSVPVAANLPTTAYAVLFAGILWDRTRRARVALVAGGIAAAIPISAAVTWLLITRFVFRFDSGGVIDSYASWSHLVGPELVDGLTSIFAYGLVAPPGPLQCRYLAEALTTYGGWNAALLIGWWIAVASGAYLALRHRAQRSVTLAASLAAGSMIAFYLYFAPQVMLLYAPQFIPALTLILAGIVRHYPRAWIALTALAVGTALVNAPMLWTVDLTDFAASCPPALQVNGAL